VLTSEEKAGRSLDDVGVVELSEAFAARAPAVIRDLDLDPAKVNPNGGAIALGHPIAATGALITAKRRSEVPVAVALRERRTRAATHRGAGGVASRAMKLLVVAPEAVDAAAVRRALPDDDLTGAEVLVVSPAIQTSGLRFWMSDADEAIQQAEHAASETAEELKAETDAAHVRATTGESEPLLALQDALATFPADRVLVFRREGDDEGYREEFLADAQERFSVPVSLARL